MIATIVDYSVMNILRHVLGRLATPDPQPVQSTENGNQALVNQLEMTWKLGSRASMWWVTWWSPIFIAPSIAPGRHMSTRTLGALHVADTMSTLVHAGHYFVEFCALWNITFNTFWNIKSSPMKHVLHSSCICQEYSRYIYFAYLYSSTLAGPPGLPRAQGCFLLGFSANHSCFCDGKSSNSRLGSHQSVFHSHVLIS